MRAVFGLVLIIGVALAGFAVYMAKDYIGNYQAALAAERANRGPQIDLTEVYVVNKTLAYGERVTDDNIRLVQYPTASLPAGVFKTADELFPQGEKRFRTVLRAMDANEVLMTTKVTNAGEDAGVSARLASGMRAFAINVDVAAGVAGFLRPGDRVDIYWTGRSVNDSVTTQDVTKLILTGVRVIAIDQMADQDRATPMVAPHGAGPRRHARRDRGRPGRGGPELASRHRGTAGRGCPDRTREMHDPHPQGERDRRGADPLPLVT